MESIHDYVLEKLRAANGTWPEVSRGSGVPYGTLKKIARREGSKSPRIDTLEKLASYFRSRDSRIIRVS